MPASDAIEEVCGISAAEILRRCREIRALRMHGAVPAKAALASLELSNPDANRSWSLMEFGDGPREAFVEAAYFALLGRQPDAQELSARLAQMGAGRTRLGILLRLALSAEGRQAQQPRVRGSSLRMLLRSARGLHALTQLPSALPAVRTSRRRIP